MRLFCAIALFSSVVVLAGCAGKPVMTASSTPTSQEPGAALKGRVHGGQSPVSGATIQLWQPGTQFNGSSAGYLISGSALTTSGEALTDANGNFDLTGQYTCPSSTTPVYITATGGNPGLSGGSINNSALVLMAALGPCGSLASLTGPIVVNEVTTVASVYALAQFMGSGGSGDNVGYYLTTAPQSVAGISNPFSEVLNIINIYTGTARTQTGSGVGTVPQTEIDTLADILVPCVNTSGPSSTSCQSLFAAATPVGGSAPTTVLGAALDIAQNPGNNVATLYGLASANAAFQPALTAAPNDWTIAVAYNVANINYPLGLSLDAEGDLWISAWVADNPFSSEVAMISPIGVAASNSPYTSSGNLVGSAGLAVDGSGNVWVANCVGNSATALKLTSNTISIAYSAISVAGMDCPLLNAVDIGGNVWFTNNSNNTVTELKMPFSATNFDTYSGGGLNKPVGITFFAFYNPSLVDSVWVGNSGASALTEFITKTGGTAGGATSNSYGGGGLNDAGGVAVDSVGDLWAIGTGNVVAEINYSGTAVSPVGGWTGGGLDGPAGIAIDGANNVWVTNGTSSTLTELNHSGTAISPSTGYGNGVLEGPSGLDIDASGNIWVLNTNESAPGYETVTEYLGVAAPSNMPLQESLPIA